MAKQDPYKKKLATASLAEAQAMDKAYADALKNKQKTYKYGTLEYAVQPEKARVLAADIVSKRLKKPTTPATPTTTPKPPLPQLEPTKTTSAPTSTKTTQKTTEPVVVTKTTTPTVPPTTPTTPSTQPSTSKLEAKILGSTSTRNVQSPVTPLGGVVIRKHTPEPEPFKPPYPVDKSIGIPEGLKAAGASDTLVIRPTTPIEPVHPHYKALRLPETKLPDGTIGKISPYGDIFYKNGRAVLIDSKGVKTKGNINDPEAFNKYYDKIKHGAFDAIPKMSPPRGYAMGGNLPQYPNGGTFGNQYTGAQLDRTQYGFGPTSIAPTGGQFQNSGGFGEYTAGLSSGTMQPQVATGQTAAGATGEGATNGTLKATDPKAGIGGMALQGLSQGINIVDSMDGKPSMLGGVASGAASGASMGMALGPMGAAAGAVIGGGLAFLQAEAQKKAQARADKLYMKNLDDQASMGSQQTLRNYASRGVTTSGAYAYGGELPQYPYGGVPATRQDSLDLYNNSIRVDNYYKTHGYTPTANTVSPSNAFSELDKAHNAVIARKAYADANPYVRGEGTERGVRKIEGSKDQYGRPNIFGPQSAAHTRVPVPGSKGGPNDYQFEAINPSINRRARNDDKFYQREITNTAMDTNAPMQFYNKAITPNKVNTYENYNKNSPMFKDVAEVYTYDPISVLPWQMMNAKQKAKRVDEYGIPKGVKYTPEQKAAAITTSTSARPTKYVPLAQQIEKLQTRMPEMEQMTTSPPQGTVSPMEIPQAGNPMIHGKQVQAISSTQPGYENDPLYNKYKVVPKNYEMTPARARVKGYAYGGGLPQYADGGDNMKTINLPHSVKNLATGEAGRTDEGMASLFADEPYDAVSLGNDLHKGNYGDAAISAGALALPVVSAYAVKKALKYAPDVLNAAKQPLKKAVYALDSKAFRTAPNTYLKARDAIKGISNAIDDKIIYPYQEHQLKKHVAKEIADLQHPEAIKRLEALGINSENPMVIPEVTYNRGEDSWWHPTWGSEGQPRINIDLKQARELKKEGYNLSPKTIFNHELGHAMQGSLAKQYGWTGAIPTSLDYRLRSIPVDEGKRYSSRKATGSYNYFFDKPTERMPHLREMRSEMLDKKIIKDKYQPITEKHIEKFAKKNTGNRILDFADLKHPDTKTDLAGWMNELPAYALPAAAGAGAYQYIKAKKPERTYAYGGVFPSYLTNSVARKGDSGLDYLDYPQRKMMQILTPEHYSATPSEYMNLRKWTDPNTTGGKAAGFAADLALDPLNVLPAAELRKIKTGIDLRKGVKAAKYSPKVLDAIEGAKVFYNGLNQGTNVVKGVSDYQKINEKKKLANGGKTPHYGGLWDTNKVGFVDSTLNANRNLDFVKRLYEPNAPSIQLPFEPKGERSTHFMASAGNMALPTIVRKPGQTGLQYLSGKKHGDPNDPVDYARQTGEYIKFLHPDQAAWFAENGYKKGTGVFNSINSKGRPYNTPGYAYGGGVPKTPTINPYLDPRTGAPIGDSIYSNPEEQMNYNQDIMGGLDRNARVDQVYENNFLNRSGVTSRDQLYQKYPTQQSYDERYNNRYTHAPNTLYAWGGELPEYGKGGKIHIKKENRGKFTAYKKRTGKTTEEALHSKNAHVRQMANFARNAAKWKHPYGGELGHENPYVQEPFNPNNQGMPNPNAEYEVEGGEMIQGQQQPMLEDGQQQQVASDLTKVPDQAPSHAEGGVQGAGGERVFSDRMKTANKKTYAEEAERLGKEKAKFEAKIPSRNEAISNTGHRMTERMDMKLDQLFNEQEMKKQLAMPPSIYSSQPTMAMGGRLPRFDGGGKFKPNYYQGKPLYYDQYNKAGAYPNAGYQGTLADPNAQYFGKGQVGNNYPYPTVFNPSTKRWYAHNQQPATGGGTGGTGGIQYSGQGIQTPTLPSYDFNGYKAGTTGNTEDMGNATKNAMQNGNGIPWQYVDNLASGIMTANTPQLAKPYMDPAVRLNTTFDINPQLQEARNTRAAMQQNIRQNTVQGGAANSNMQQLYASSLDNANGLYAQKNNVENGLKNQEITLNSGINSRNNDKRYAYDVEQTKRRAGIQQDVVENARNFALDQYTSRRDAQMDARDLELGKMITMANPNSLTYASHLDMMKKIYASDPERAKKIINNTLATEPNNQGALQMKQYLGF